MSFQILDIVLYGTNGERRVLSLRPGMLNIITGISKTGKTDLIEIIDYCFGSEKCGISEGKMRKAVEWVGIRLKVKGGQVFIARRLPNIGKNSSTDVYYDLQRDLQLPSSDMLRQTINPQTLENLLTQHAGIGEYIHYPPDGQTRPPKSPKIRDALFFCLQHQTEIGSNKHLFHRQSEQFIPQTIKDVLPYFLGAVNENYVVMSNEARQLKRNLRSLELVLNEHEGVSGQGINQAQMLLSEAQHLNTYHDTLPGKWEECVEALRQIQSLNIDNVDEINQGDDTYKLLNDEYLSLSEELNKIKTQLDIAKELAFDRSGYSHEASIQLYRLKSIGRVCNLLNWDLPVH